MAIRQSHSLHTRESDPGRGFCFTGGRYNDHKKMKDSIVEFCQVILSQNYFQFKDKYYTQKTGLPVEASAS